jgi:hypothetical protein
MINTILYAEKFPGRYRLLVTDEHGTDIHEIDTLGEKNALNIIKGDAVFYEMSEIVIGTVLNKLGEIGIRHQSYSLSNIWQIFRDHYREGVNFESADMMH